MNEAKFHEGTIITKDGYETTQKRVTKKNEQDSDKLPDPKTRKQIVNTEGLKGSFKTALSIFILGAAMRGIDWGPSPSRNND